MRPRLLDYEPPIAPSMPVGAHGIERLELDEAATALEAMEQGEGEAWIVRLLDGATRRRQLAPTRRARLAMLLSAVARRTLRRRNGQRSAAIGRLYALELEGLSAEDQWFELARRFVRLAHRAATHAALDSARTAPDVSARRATRAAARDLAPGLIPFLAVQAAKDFRPHPGA
jgi:hypothetical protein